MREALTDIILCVVSCLIGSIITYFHYVPPLEDEIARLNNLKQQEAVSVEKNTTTSIGYVAKKNANDNDIELKDKGNISVSVNDKVYELKPQVKETTKLENNKVVIEKEENVNIDLSGTVNSLANEKAKKYGRYGTADFGVLYNGKGKDCYGGIRYNAKKWDLGYYHNVNDNDWLVGFHYKF